MSFLTWRWLFPQKEHWSWSDGSLILLRPPLSYGFHYYAVASVLLVLADDVVDHAVLDTLFGPHYVVAVGVALYLLVRLARVLSQDLIEASLGPYELLSVDLHVRGLSRKTSDARLMQQYPRVRQRVALPLRPGCQEKGPHRGRHP